MVSELVSAVTPRLPPLPTEKKREWWLFQALHLPRSRWVNVLRTEALTGHSALPAGT